MIGRAMRRRGARRRGAVLVVAALLMVAMIGMMALTLDGGSLLAERRRAQAVADAAATAAACDLTYNYGFNLGLDPQGTAAASALATAAADGYANDGTTTAVVLNVPPKSGRFAGSAGYAEAVVTYNQPRSFAAIFGSTAAVPVSSRAVARGQWQPQAVAFLATEPALPAALTVALNGQLAVKNGAADINSTSFLSFALALNGQVSAPTFNFAGGGLSLLNGSISGAANYGATPTPDPLAYLSPPDPTTLPVRSNGLLGLSLGSTTLQPGLYKGGIRVALAASVTLQPGLYYMQGGGFSAAGTGSITGIGVTIVNAPVLPTDAITIAATGNVDLTPPTSGLYQGVTIMQPPALISLPLNINPTTTIGANSLLGSSFSVSGTVYAPSSIVALAGNNQAKVASQLICRTAVVAANASVQVDWDSNTARTPLPVRLVE